MNTHIQALRDELKARFEAVSKTLDQIEAIIQAPLTSLVEPPCVPTPAASPAPSPAPAKRAAKDAKSKPSRPSPRANINATEQRVRETIATLAEPFATRDVFVAMEKSDAAFARKIADSGTLGYLMKKLRDAGQLVGDGIGKGMTYTRSKKFSVGPQLSEQEAAYRKLRAEIPTPSEAD